MSDNARSWQMADGFDAFYQKKIEPALKQFEKRRLQEIYLVYASWAVAAAGLGLVFLIDDSHGWLVMLGMGLIAAGLVSQHRLRRRMNEALKNLLVQPVCEFFGLSFRPRPIGMDIRRFINAGLLPASHDWSYTEDQITGKHQGVQVDLCELKLEKKVRNGEKTEAEIIFQGLILTYRFAKKFSGETRVISNSLGLLGRMVRTGYKPQARGERVHLEDPVFEEQFDVYSTDQIEARYLLTPRFMERLIALREHFSKEHGLSVAFSGNDLLICLRSGKDRFEGGSLFRNLSHRERAESLLAELEEILSIVDVLDLTSKTRV